MKSPSTSTAFSATAASTSGPSPEATVRRLVEAASGVNPLPPTKGLELHHIRGVSNPKFSGGPDEERVIFTPEFMYVLDVGFPSRAGVLLTMNVNGAGDPTFPDFADHALRSVIGVEPRHLIMPCVAGKLLVAVKAGTPEAQVRAVLAPHVKDISVLVTDLYAANVQAFHESKIADTIEGTVPFVRYAQHDFIIRVNDFAPGWRVDRVF